MRGLWSWLRGADVPTPVSLPERETFTEAEWPQEWHEAMAEFDKAADDLLREWRREEGGGLVAFFEALMRLDRADLRLRELRGEPAPEGVGRDA